MDHFKIEIVSPDNPGNGAGTGLFAYGGLRKGAWSHSLMQSVRNRIQELEHKGTTVAVAGGSVMHPWIYWLAHAHASRPRTLCVKCALHPN